VKNVRPVFTLLLAVVLLAGLAVTAFAANPSMTAEQMAADLNAWGLFRGVSDSDFDLYRKPTRTEALIMLIRAEGEESAALAGSWEHPFTDVPAWADAYVGYGYETGLTKGVSDTLFGAAAAAGADMYLTFMLRALGYDDDAGDFSWDSPYALATELGLLTGSVDTRNFWRRDMVIVSFHALECARKGSSQTLGEFLGVSTGSHPSAALCGDCRLLADYFGVDLYDVTVMVDAVNTLLASDGCPESYSLAGIGARIDSGELDRYKEDAADAQEALRSFARDETLRVYSEQ
jgi:hypothetical protein